MNQWEYGTNIHHSVASECTRYATLVLNNCCTTGTLRASDKLFIGQEGYKEGYPMVTDAGDAGHLSPPLLPSGPEGTIELPPQPDYWYLVPRVGSQGEDHQSKTHPRRHRVSLYRPNDGSLPKKCKKR